jgi:thiol-disulfide isomerase/thioredoxin
MYPFARPFALICLVVGLIAGEAAVGTFPPDLVVKRTINNPAGKGPVRLDAFLGKVVLIDFWATWCGPCKTAIPHLKELHEKYASQGLVVIGHTDESSDGLEEFVKSTSIPYLITIGTEIGGSWGVKGIPHVFVLDPDGRIAWSGHPGSLQEKVLTGLLTKVKPSWPPTPRFAKPSSEPKVAAIEQVASSGKVGSALKSLAKLSTDGAKATGEQLAAWKVEQDAALASLAEAGDVYGAWRLADALADAHKGTDDAASYAERAATLKKDPAYEVGKEFQKLLAVPPAGRTGARYSKSVESFRKKHTEGFYAEQAKTLID